VRRGRESKISEAKGRCGCQLLDCCRARGCHGHRRSARIDQVSRQKADFTSRQNRRHVIGQYTIGQYTIEERAFEVGAR
jgi:hypothetical protein